MYLDVLIVHFYRLLKLSQNFHFAWFLEYLYINLILHHVYLYLFVLLTVNFLVFEQAHVLQKNLTFQLFLLIFGFWIFRFQQVCQLRLYFVFRELQAY